MTRITLGIALVAALAACAPQTHSYSWYRAHPDDAAKAMADCGASRSVPCANAEKALADAKSQQRQDMYRKAF